MTNDVYRCPTCGKPWLTEQMMRTHSSQVHDEPVGHREVEPESLAVGEEDAPEPLRGLR